MKELMIDKLTELLIKQDFYEKEKGKKVYIEKKQVYSDLIKFIKEQF